MEEAFRFGEFLHPGVVRIAIGDSCRPMEDSRPLFSLATDQKSPLYDEVYVSLGSSPRSTTNHGPEAQSPLSTINLEAVTNCNSTYLRVSSSFNSSNTWQAFLADLRDLLLDEILA